MIRNRTDFYFDDNSLSWSTDYMPRLLAVVDAWLSCSVKIYREGFEIMMALSRCRGINSLYVTQASAQIERYLKAIMKQNRDLERSWHRDPVNPQPGPVLVAEFNQPTLDEDGVPTVPSASPEGHNTTVPSVSPEGSTITTSDTDEGIMSLVRRHYNQMHSALSADPRAHADDIDRAACLSLLDQEYLSDEVRTSAPSASSSSPSTTTVLDSSSVEKKPTTRRRRRNQ